MSDLIQCILDNGFTTKELKEHLPTGQPLDDTTVANAYTNLKKAETKLSQQRLAAEKANIELAVRVQKMTKPKAEGGDGLTPREAVKALLVRDTRDRANGTNLQTLQHGFQARINMPLNKVAESFRTTATGGMRDPNLMKDAFRVAGGGKASSNEAALLGAALRDAMDTGHRLARNAGADIGHIPNYLPQVHTPGSLRKAGRDQWMQDVFKRLDRTKMLDRQGNPLSDEALLNPEDGLLPFVYKSITTEGRHRIKPPVELQDRFRADTSARTSMERVLHFKSVDDGLWYNDNYGNADMWGTLTNHLHGMATTAAVHKMFGPMPDVVFFGWRDWATKADRFNDLTEIEHIWRNIVGFEHNGETPILHIANAARDTLSSAFMGSAILASVPDVVMMAMNGAMNGMNVPRMLANTRRYANAGDRELLNRTAGHIEYAVSTMSASLRFEDTIGRGLTHRLSDATYRLSGMTGWMNALRHGWLSEFQTMLGNNLDKPIDKLPKEIRSWLDTYGLANRWDDIRKMDTQDLHGSRVADFSSLQDDDLIAEVLGAVYTERDLAVMTPDARVRALLNQGTAPGSAKGELLRSAGQFKTFAASIIMHGVTRYMLSKRLGSATNRAAWTMTMLMGMTMLGGVAFQLREMAKGRDPRPMDTSDFLLRSIAQGGAVPGLAELILDGQTRYGASAIETALGPTGSLIGTGVRGAVGTAGAALGVEGGAETALSSLESGTYMVPGSNIWYSRAAVQRLMRDTLMEFADPNYAERQRRSEINRQNEFDQDVWWGYGDTPEAPEFDNLLGDLQ